MKMKRYCIDMNHRIKMQRIYTSKKWMIKINKDLKLKLKIR